MRARADTRTTDDAVAGVCDDETADMDCDCADAVAAAFRNSITK